MVPGGYLCSKSITRDSAVKLAPIFKQPGIRRKDGGQVEITKLVDSMKVRLLARYLKHSLISKQLDQNIKVSEIIEIYFRWKKVYFLFKQSD